MASSWEEALEADIRSGFVRARPKGPGAYAPQLVANSPGSTVEHSIVHELRRSNSFSFSVAFITPGAIAQLKQHFLGYSGQGTIVTSDYLGFNQAEAFSELLLLRDLCGFDVRRHTGQAFHPKGYLFDSSDTVTAIIGSSNLTNAALSKNQEWNLRVSAAKESDLGAQLKKAREDHLSSSEPITVEWVERYREDRVRSRVEAQTNNDRAFQVSFEEVLYPNKMQKDALFALNRLREKGAKKAIIVSATGTGKTMLSAFDVRATTPNRVLFVSHREQILDRTIEEYKKVLGGEDSDYGKLTGSNKDTRQKYLFATVQSLSKPDALAALNKDAFDYVVVDEAHRSAAATFRRVIDYFEPKFLLGMTATPERTDGFNVFELFDYNVPYEIRLSDALENDMLSPFHYYGVSDVELADGTTVSEISELRSLVSVERVEHLVAALENYGQAGRDPKGLIFCSRTEEAKALAEALRGFTYRGRPIRTVALTGEDSVETREEQVTALEAGDLDYILTVDVFNEGVDIPSLNQVVMLRQTQSAIVFVQQLGRGLRKFPDKDHLVVIDFIGNYANNFLIPIALFGDESLKKESLRQKLNQVVEAGAMPGLSSVSFDEISRERVLSAVAEARLDSMAALKNAILNMQNRVGAAPTLFDFYRFGSVDPVVLATKRGNYPLLLEATLGEPNLLDDRQSKALSLLSNEALAAKRTHELVLLQFLLRMPSATKLEIQIEFERRGLYLDYRSAQNALQTLSLGGFPAAAIRKYGETLIRYEENSVFLDEWVLKDYQSAPYFRDALDDLITTGIAINSERYSPDSPLTIGAQYTRAEAAHLLGWDRAVSSTIYGVKTDVDRGLCVIFVTLEKDEDVSASTAYRDELLDAKTLRWFSKSNRTTSSKDVAPIVSNEVEIHVFVKKNDAEGGDHYYLGVAAASDARDTSMPGSDGATLPVVEMKMNLLEPLSQGLFDYLA